MKAVYFFLLAVLMYSCGTPVVEKKPEVDHFRESVAQLTRAGLLKNIPATQLDSLSAIYKKDTDNGLKELLVKSGDLLKINVSLNGRTLQDVYQKICDTIGMKYPELKCDEVQFSVLPTHPGGHDTDWVALKVRFGQTWYERKLYYLKKWQIDDFVYRIYNRKLADDGKPVRLHLIEYTCTECAKTQDDFMGATDVTRYGYMMLTKAQEDSLLMIPALEMEPENEFAIYTTAQMNASLQQFEASGLAEVVGAATYQTIKTNVLQSSLYTQQDLYDFADTLFAFISFDTADQYNPYEQILMDMAKISRGKFNPSQITDDQGANGRRTVAFAFGGDVYKFEAEQRGGFLFPGVIDNVNKALADNNAGGAFYTIANPREDASILVYIDDALVEKVKASGLFPQLEKGPSMELKGRWSAAMAL